MEDDFKPVIQPQRRLNPKVQDVVKNEIVKLLDSGLIYPISDSSWVSPIHVVPKKGGMTVVLNDNNELIPSRTVTGWRVCIDYRFFQIPIAPEDQEKTTFTCPYGTFAYRRMPFGLCNAPATFQRCMTTIFHDMVEDFMEVFMDDFSVFGSDTRPPMLDEQTIEFGNKRIRLGNGYLDVIAGGGLRCVVQQVQYVLESIDLSAAERKVLELYKDDRESQLYDEFEHFRQIKGENIQGYYVRFTKLINDMRNIKMTMSRMQLNSKFVNNMLPEWSRFITEVKLNRGLKESNCDQLYAYLKQHEVHANENIIMMERFGQPNNDPLALVSDASVQQYPTQSSKSPQPTKEPSPADNFQMDSGSSSTENLIESLSNTLALLTQSGKVVVQDVRGRYHCDSNQEDHFAKTIQGEMHVNVQGQSDFKIQTYFKDQDVLMQPRRVEQLLLMDVMLRLCVDEGPLHRPCSWQNLTSEDPIYDEAGILYD
ncbi:reverse transcriptase domain-containing protein [Tanacetum coccineum]